MTKIITLLFFAVFATPMTVFAWEGYDTITGNTIEIESGNLVREGETIQIFDYGTGQYKDVEVSDINRYGNNVEVETFDWETGTTSTYEMSD